MTDRARLFFALDPDERVRQRLGRIQADLALPARRVPLPNLHITLAFLGDVAAADIGRLQTLAGTVDLPAVRLMLDRLGWFPRAGVAWLGCARPPPALSEFQQALTRCLLREGFAPDTRAWQPHVTLYRNLRTRWEKIPFEAVAWPLQGFCLLRSTSAERGPRYEPLGHWQASG